MRSKTNVWLSAGMGLCLALVVSDALAAQTTRYVVLFAGSEAGYQEVRRGDNGVTDVVWTYKNNGRGPDLEERFTLAADGTFRTYEVKGTSTFGSPVAESFSREDNRVRWKSTSDEGVQAIAGLAQYSPLDGSYEALSVALGALARSPEGRLPLIPSGTLTMRRVAEAEVTSGAGTRTVQLVALRGVGLRPTFVWATTGESPRLFAAIVPGWRQVIEDGWQGNADALELRQKEAEVQVLVDLQRSLAHPLAGTTLIRDARLFDSEQAKLGPTGDVLLRDGRIVSIPSGGGEGSPADHVIEANGRVLLPGLLDSHGHIGHWEGGLHLAAGVTTVRDMGNDNAFLQQLMADAEAGRVMAPRVVAVGFIEGQSEFSSSGGFLISTLDEAKRAVDWYADNGYRQIKIYNSFPKELLRETAAYAHHRGLRVGGHVPAFMRAREVVEQGYDEIQHINQVLLNFLVDDRTDTRTLERFRLVADGTAGLDFDSPPVQEFIALLASRQTVIDPTLATFDFIRQRAGELSQAYAAVAEHLPPDEQRGLRAASMDIPDDAIAARYEKSYQKLIEFVGRLHRAGVPIVAGTDWTAGFTLQRELELYVQAGMTPSEALQTATWNGAKYAGVLDDRGSIAVGKRADLILVDGDPTTDIGDIRKVALVIKGDVAYHPGEIYEALGIRPFTSPLKVETVLASGQSTAQAASASGVAAARAPAQSPDIGAAVRDFDAYVAQGVRDWDVPGLSIAVVQNDSVVFAKGYGVRALGEPGAVDEHTLFAILSTTKAMTAAAMAMLVDDGKLAWSDPVSKWLPEMQFPDPFMTRELTVKDLLIHNTGLGYADLLWSRDDLDVSEILRRVRYLRPAYSLRSSFVYQNIMYGAAGQVIARASGMSYPEFLRTRIFVPLGMTRTYPTYGAMSEAADPNTSRPHFSIRDTVRVIDETTADVMPAMGATWSTASDMARWAGFLLDSARVDGLRLISPGNFAELFRPQVLVPEEEFYETMQLTRPRWTSYGLGWFQQDYNGRHVAFHTGSLPGRTALIGLVPDERLAVIVFGNLHQAELRQALMLRAIDVFAGTNGAPPRDWSAEILDLYRGLERSADERRKADDAKRIANTQPTLPLAAYAGTYTHPAWGTFVVTEQDRRLHATIGVGARNTGPIEHWHYDSFRAVLADTNWGTIPLQFEIGTDGTVARLLAWGRDKYTFERVR